MSELKPCFRCQSKNVKAERGHNEDEAGWGVQCKECWVGTTVYPTKDKAVAFWNTRTPDPDTVKVLEEIEEYSRNWREYGESNLEEIHAIVTMQLTLLKGA